MSVDEEGVCVKNAVKESAKAAKKSAEPEREPRPDSTQAELCLAVIDPVHQSLNKCNRKLFALKKQKGTMEMALATTPDNIFHRKERKELQTRIDRLQRQIDATKEQMQEIPI